MWDKKTVISIGLFVAFLVLVLLLRENPYEKSADQTFPDKFPSIDKDALDKIDLTSTSDSVVLEKRSDGWVVSSARKKKDDKWEPQTEKDVKANADYVKQALEKLSKIDIAHMISENKNKHSEFEVDEKGMVVKVSKGGVEQGGLIVGKNTSDYSGSFVRTVDSDRVYATKGALRSAVVRKYEDWRDKTIIDFENDDAVSLTIERLGKETYTFNKKEAPAPEVKPGATDAAAAAGTEGTGGTEGKADVPQPVAEWKLEGNDVMVVDNNRILPAISGLGKLKWTEIVDEPKEPVEYHLDQSQAIVTVKLKDGKSYKATFAAGKTEQTLWVSVEGRKPVYLIQKYIGEKYLKDPGYFDKEAVAAEQRAARQNAPQGGAVGMPGGRPGPGGPGGPGGSLEQLPPEIRRQLEEQMRRQGAQPPQ